MFSNLVESGSHHTEAARTVKYFLATTAFYALLIAATGIGSIYAYNAHLEDRTDYEVVALLSYRDEQPRPRDETSRSGAVRPTATSTQRVAPVVIRDLMTDNPNLVDRPVARSGARVLAPGVPFVIDTDADGLPLGLPPGVGVAGDGRARQGAGREIGPVIADVGQPPASPPRVSSAFAPSQRPEGPVKLPSTVISGKAIEKPIPPYPPLARQAGAQGMVPVLIVVDEQGRVVSARASGGHPLLRQAAEQAAHRARFEPTLLSGQPVKVTGVITYNFLLH